MEEGWARSGRAHGVDHQLHVLGIGVGRDAVAEVEDMRAVLEDLDDVAGLIDQGLAAGDHMGWGEVALDAAVFLDIRGAPFG